MSNLTEKDTQFVENIDGAFHQLFKAAGISIGQNGLERIREIATTLAAEFENKGEVKAIEVIQVLQRAVTNAFKELESDLRDREAHVNERFRKIESRLDKLVDQWLDSVTSDGK